MDVGMSNNPSFYGKGTYRACRFALRFARRTASKTLILLLVIQIILAAFPAVQAWLISLLGTSLQEDPGNKTVFLVLLVALLLAGFVSLQDVCGRLGDILRLTIAWQGRLAVDQKVSRIDPKQLRQPEVNKRTRQALEVVSNGNLSVQATAVTSVIFAVFVCIFLFLSLFRFSTLGAVLLLLSLIPSLLTNFYCSKKLAEQWERNNDYHRHANYFFEQMMYQSPGTELALLDGREWFRSQAGRYRNKAAALDRGVHAMYIKAEIINGLVTVVIFAFCLLAFLLHGNASPVEATAALVGISSGLFAIHNVGWSVGMLMQETKPLLMLEEFLALPEMIPPLPVVHQVAALNAKDIDVTIGDRTIVSHACLHAHCGEVVALVGANGAGKTSLLSALVGLYDVSDGSILVSTDSGDHRELNEQDFAERHRYFGMLAQDYSRFELTVRENLCLGLDPSCWPSDEKLWEALRMVGAQTFVTSLDMQLGEQWKGTGLSGGQWQRLALARLYIRDAGIWILDEPTSSIDARGEAEIFSCLRALSSRKVVIVVTHRASTLQNLDRIYYMEGGRVEESGTFTELVSRDSGFRRLFASQLQDTNIDEAI